MNAIISFIKSAIAKYNRWMDAEVEQVLSARNPLCIYTTDDDDDTNDW